MLDAEKLKKLKDNGHISEEEYIDEKKRLAAQIIKREDPAHAKNGIFYILLGWFLGTLGLHNFYAGYWGRALVQLTLTIVSPWFLYIPLLIVGIWVFVEILFVNKAPHHIPFKGNRGAILALRGLAIVAFALAAVYNDMIFEQTETGLEETLSGLTTEMPVE